MQIAIVGANYSPGDADQLRRDMAAWKRHGRLLRHRERLLQGFKVKGISEEFGNALFEQIKGFGEYGFPESHAASFALLVYSSAWLKRHRPAHFTCALLNSQPMGFYSPHSLVRDAQRHGVVVRDVDVSYSHWQSSLEWSQQASDIEPTQRILRLGLHQVTGLGETVGKSIEKARAENPFSDAHDLVRRSCIERTKLELLAEAGALDSLIKGRRDALWFARKPRAEALFESTEASELTPLLTQLSSVETLRFDYATKQLSVSDHPLKHLRAWLKQRRVSAIAGLVALRHHERTAVAGLVLCRQKPYTASGMLFMTIEDETGVANLVVEPRVQDRYGLLLRQAGILIAWGRLERSTTKQRDDVPVLHVRVEAIERIDRMPRALRGMSRDFH